MATKSNHIKENQDDKALIKSTGEILDIKHTYMTYTVKVTFGDESSNALRDLMYLYKTDVNFEDDPELNLGPNSIKTDVIINSDKSGVRTKYKLSNGNSYDESELIVGSQNIRDTKLNKILQDGI